MKKLKLLVVLGLFLLLSILVLQNHEPYQVRFLWLTGELSGIVLLFLTASAGFIAGVTAGLLVKRRQ